MPELLSRLQSALADRYRLDREVGAGGMATVYLAQDIRHDRRVAVKVLRPELAAVIGAERFLAEIKLTANLQHPHILPLFDSGEAVAGHESRVAGDELATRDSGPATYLFYVMPFVEGETLRDRLTREKQLPVADAVRIATEVAGALDYAHRHGVVHRDIKPENILLHDGQALVADFGIALAASKAGGSRMTETGMSLGTPHYMSPEQAMGEREITARSDVYALGAVLYEMLTGDPPFTGSTAQAVVARVVTESPRSLTTQRHTIPPHVEAAVLTALEKLPADRFASAAEFAEALGDKRYSTGAPTTAMPAAAGAAVGARAAGRRPSVVTLAAVAVAVIATAAALWGWLRPKPAPTVQRYSVMLRPNEGLRPSGVAGNLAISPDGNRIAYIGVADGGTRLWLREHDKLRPLPIAGTENGLSPFFSHDGNQVAFTIAGRSLRVAPLNGGPPVTLSDSINSSGGDWGTDGYIYIELEDGIGRIKATGGPIEKLFTMSDAKHEIGAEYPNVMPDGKGIVFRRRLTGQAPNEFEIMEMAVPHGTPHLVARGVYARYVNSGHLLVVTGDGKLLAMPFDPKKRAVTGPSVAVMDGLLRSGPFEVNFAVSATGTLAYSSGGTAAATTAWWVGRDGLAVPMDTTWKFDGDINSVALSPDGRALAVTLARGATADIWVKQLPSGPFSRVTFGDTVHLRAAWAGDGRSLVYINDLGSGAGLPMMARANGTGAPQGLLRTQMQFAQAVPTADGKWLVLRRSFAEPGAGDIYGLKTGDTTPVPLLTTGAREMSPTVSPDGRWLAYVSNESGRDEVYVRPFPDVASAKWQVSVSGGTVPMWARNGRELFYLDGKGEMTSLPIVPGPGFAVGQPKVLFSASPFVIGGNAGVYDVSPDGQRFVMVRPATVAGESELVVVQNWFEELRARVGK
ncbi:MAG TPA: protein kinase [Gemmatimonadales bacterium]|nr:protein kinase [Gemmatimonadales bacterium]